MAEITSVKKLLSRKNLAIPAYQRPYKWTTQNIDDLLCDIQNAIKESKNYSDYKYRVGTVILNDNAIVDGQQRIITLSLINLYLDENFSNSIIEMDFCDKSSMSNIHANYQFIKEWFVGKNDEERVDFRKSLDEVLEVVVIEVKNISDAFQVFDSQNYRGKTLDPHDLLKAYHLREMKRSLEKKLKSIEEMKPVVTKWESYSPKDIRFLFNRVLFPIQNWSRMKKTVNFTSKEIGSFKGVTEDAPYLYAKYVCAAMPNFQLTEPFVAGQRFFEMVDYYMDLLKKVKQQVIDYDKFKLIAKWLDPDKEIEDINKNSSGYKYACNLFYCALLCYYDKFGNLQERIVRKIFSWAFMLRANMEHLGYDTVNKYAIGGEDNDRYTNHVALFSEINNASQDRDIAKIKIEINETDSNRLCSSWSKLYNDINILNG